MIDQVESPAGSKAGHAEHALIGALLDGSRKKLRILQALGNGECLKSARLRQIHSVCRAMHAEGLEANLISVADRLESTGRLAEVGGHSFLAWLVSECFVSDAHIEQLCAEVRRAHRARRIEEAIAAAKVKLDAGGNPDQVIADLTERLTGLLQDGQSAALQVMSISELLDKEVSGVSWCVDRLIPSNGLGMITGDSGVGKTWLLLDLGISVAGGTPWLDTFATTKGTVLFIDEESGEGLLQERLLKLYNPAELWNLPVHFATFEGLKVDTESGVVRLRATIKETGATLVLIDSFVRIHDADENSAQEMSGVTEPLLRTVREQNCAIVVAHHPRKQSQHSSNDPGQMMRGTSELKAALDVHLYVSRAKNGAIRFQHEKARHGETVEPLLVKLEKQADGQLRLTATDESAAKLQEAREAIVQHLKGAEGPVLRKNLEEEVRKETGVSSGTFSKALSRVKEEEALEEGYQTEQTEKRGTRNLKTFALKPGSCNGSGPHSADFERGG